MKSISTLSVFLTAVITQVALYGQQPFNKDLYVPVPLQQYTPPKDSAYKENMLVAYNMLEKKFDTGYNGIYSNNLNRKSSTFDNERNSEFIKNETNQPYTFSNLQPADQLAGFPNYPMSAVVKLFVTFFNPANNQNSFGTCSGVMIHPGFILTGGHCVKSKFDSSYAVACTVVPAYNLGGLPFGLTTTTNWYSFTQWTMNGNLDYDMAIMSLADPIGNETGWFDLGYTPNDSFFTSSSNVFHSFGYPGYDSFGIPVFEEGERMYYMNGYMDYWQSVNTICHYNIGYQGQSGSGLYHQDTSNNRYVYGVLSHGGGIVPPFFTCHCRMDSSMFNYFNSIIPMVSDIDSESPSKQVYIYPNPSNGVFNFDFSELQYHEINIHVFDVFGQLITKESFGQFNAKSTINLTPYPSGTYFIKAEIDGISVNGRICKTE